MKEDGSRLGEFGGVADELRSALVFLTRLPPSVLGADAAVRPDFTTAARVFPIAGALIGAAGAAVLVACWLLGIPGLVAGVLAIAATMVLTGALHEDGLADAADSFGGATRERKFAIMDDSRIGTFGAAALVISLLVRVGALAAIFARNPLAAALALIAGEAVSRAALVRMWHDLPAARADGLAKDTGPPDYNAMLVALTAAALIAIATALPALGWRATALAGLLSIAATYGAIRLTANTLGGSTGDALGACQQMALAAFLIGASAI